MSNELNLRRKKLAWGCRRGMLELDLSLAFIVNNLDQLSEDEIEQAENLLDLNDTELWDMLVTGSKKIPKNVSKLAHKISNTNQIGALND